MKDTLVENIISAIEKNELQAYYQPQYDARKGVIGGAEALVRWIKPDGTIIPPSGFIPELEKQGKVSIVDWYIAEEACKTIKELGDRAVRISVNFGREHAKDDAFVEKLNNLINKYEIDKSLLGIEITESDLSAENNDVISWVNTIEDAGYTVSIDDFGSGMSSLSFIKDISAKVLKIDKRFLEDNCQSQKGRITLESVFYLAHRLKLTTVVEGVETKEQLQFINTCDCDYIQGYIFSRPVSHDDLMKMCVEESPVAVDYLDPFENQVAFGQIRVLIESVYKKFPLIVYINLTKNSYQIMRKENYIETSFAETGTYDEGYEFVKNQCAPEDQPAIEAFFSRESLMAAYERGEQRVVKIVNQYDENGVKHRRALEDYFIQNPSSKDIYVVSFVHSVEFDDDTYIGDAR